MPRLRSRWDPAKGAVLCHMTTDQVPANLPSEEQAPAILAQGGDRQTEEAA